MASCARTIAQTQTGKIIFYRESHLRNYDYRPPVFCDGIELARIVNGSSLDVDAEPGRHSCVAESADGPATTIDIVPGNVAYLRMDITPTVKRHAFLITTTEEEYRRQKKLTPLASTHLNAVQPTAPSTETPEPTFANTESQERAAKFGDLVVTATNLEMSAIASAPDRRQIAVFLSINNKGTGAVCASFNAKLKTTFGFEYVGITSGGPSMRQLLPGESTQGIYVFDVKSGVQPLELKLILRGVTIPCLNSDNAAQQDAALPNEIHLDVHDLPGLSAGVPKLEDTYRPSVGGVTHPRCIYCPDPQYSAEARHAKIEGSVVLKAVIGVDGHASNIEIVEGVGHGLNEQAVNAVQAWRFEPARGPNGEPVATTVPIEIVFRMLH
jgi:TonB family protein